MTIKLNFHDIIFLHLLKSFTIPMKFSSFLISDHLKQIKGDKNYGCKSTTRTKMVQ